MAEIVRPERRGNSNRFLPQVGRARCGEALMQPCYAFARHPRGPSAEENAHEEPRRPKTPRAAMKRYLLLTAAMMGVFLLLFALVEALEIPLLTNPSDSLAGLGVLAAPAGVGLLVADVVLPVPSSLVMVANGALFGVKLGTLLSLTGTLGAGLFGFSLGRRGGSLLNRLVSAEERARANDLLDRWGALAVVATRPVPVLAETVAILAGSSPMTWRRMSLATVAGALPGSLLYAVAGASAAAFASTAAVFALVLALTGVFWLVGRRLRRGQTAATSDNDLAPARQARGAPEGPGEEAHRDY